MQLHNKAHVPNDYEFFLPLDNQIAKRQVMLSPGDVIVVDVMDIDNVLMVVFVVGSETIFNSAEMIDIMQTVGPQIAQELQDALMSLVSQPNFIKGHRLQLLLN